VIDQNNKPYLFPEGKDFKSIADFESKNGVKIKALMSNYPALINNGKNIVSDFKLDQKQLTTKGFRGGIGFKDKKMFFFIAEKATVPDLASVAESLGMDVALNLDGGASSALYYNNGYLVGPNRLLPTAIVVRKK
jgi:exopolysaccharide biosynthesis protein